MCTSLKGSTISMAGGKERAIILLYDEHKHGVTKRSVTALRSRPEKLRGQETKQPDRFNSSENLWLTPHIWTLYLKMTGAPI